MTQHQLMPCLLHARDVHTRQFIFVVALRRDITERERLLAAQPVRLLHIGQREGLVAAGCIMR